jgi:general stress protein 26
MKPAQIKVEILRLIKENRAASLATVDNKGIPHVAVVYCVVSDDLTLHFITRAESRKYENILHQPTVALSFLDEDNMSTVQMTGAVKRIDDLDKEQEIMYKLMTKVYEERELIPPPLQLFGQGATNELAVLEITPKEMSYATFKTDASGRFTPHFHKYL